MDVHRSAAARHGRATQVGFRSDGMPARLRIAIGVAAGVPPWPGLPPLFVVWGFGQDLRAFNHNRRTLKGTGFETPMPFDR
jgi:hypothetical protein